MGVLAMRALLLEVSIKAPVFWKLPNWDVLYRYIYIYVYMLLNCGYSSPSNALVYA